MEHVSGIGKQHRNSATSWNQSSGQFAVSADQLCHISDHGGELDFRETKVVTVDENAM